MAKIKSISREDLERLYWDEKLSSYYIALRLGVCSGTILKWLRDYKIKVKTTSESSTGRIFSKKARAKMSAAKSGPKNVGWGKISPNNGGIKTQEKRKLRSRISRSIRGHLKGDGKKGGRAWQALVGYSDKQLERRLKSTLPDGYDWKRDFVNGKGVLHIDHIIPVSAFNFTKPEDEDFKRCWALKNLRLIPAKQNIKKHATLSKHFQPSLIFSDKP